MLKVDFLEPVSKQFSGACLAIITALLCNCGPGPTEEGRGVLRVSAGGKINTLDPALAADLTSAYMVSNFYDTPLQYSYTERPYRLVPSMLQEMPEVNGNFTRIECELRRDLKFHGDQCFPDEESRRVTSEDVVFSILRLADSRLHSPGFWLIRGKIKGIDEFRELTGNTEKGDFSPYDRGCPGLEIIDKYRFRILLDKPDPRFLYALAMPYLSVVPRKAVEKYSANFAEHPVGSGPFEMTEWIRNYRIRMDRYHEYRTEYFQEAENLSDRDRPLPLLDSVVCYLVKQQLSGWLLFLQGELDYYSLDKDNFDAVVNENLELVDALKQRDIRMLQIPDFRINYIGFNFSDPVLAGNLHLRRAISLAYNVQARVKHANYRLVPAHGPVPPGVAGHNPELKNPYSRFDLEKAREEMEKAGYPDGISAETGKRLELRFDQGGNTPDYRQLAELMVKDMKRIGIKINPVLNNKPVFFQKLRKGELQLFRLSWIGDYPDAENFLQLFYAPNAGSCNRAFYRNEKFDRMFEEIQTMPHCTERTRKYKEMAEWLTLQCPWIFESYPSSYSLLHPWVENFHPHNFPYGRWKYLSINANTRKRAMQNFRPLKMRDLRH